MKACLRVTIAPGRGEWRRCSYERTGTGGGRGLPVSGSAVTRSRRLRSVGETLYRRLLVLDARVARRWNPGRGPRARAVADLLPGSTQPRGSRAAYPLPRL